MRVLVINAGSSSVKYKLLTSGDGKALDAGQVDGIGGAGRFQRVGAIAEAVPVPDHGAAFALVKAALADAEPQAVGHRVVHGGERFRAAAPVDREVLDAIRGLASLAPLHNPACVAGIELSKAMWPALPQVAVFDTAFHRSLPDYAQTYALPAAWREGHGVRRYGFHGISVQSALKRVAIFLGQAQESLNLVVLHLGHGASITAIRAGVSVDTSMGMTPLAGLVMGSRCGDLDPGVLLHLLRQGVAVEELERGLNWDSGLKGLCGDADMRAVERRALAGDGEAELALAAYCYRVKHYLGAYSALLGRLDAVVFTAGVGEHSAEVRRRICEGLESIGLILAPDPNMATEGGLRAVHATASRVPVLVVPADEEREIAEQTAALIGQR